MERAGAVVKNGHRSGAGPLKRFGTMLLDQLYPPVCLVCDAAVASADAFCPACFALLRPITAPLCPRLGIPFEVAIGPDALSAEAIAHPPPFARARSAVRYDEIARTLVSRLKYGDRPELARFCARLMDGAGTALWANDPVLVPVPLHRGRLLLRRYNQSAELARALSARTGLTMDAGLVRRIKPTRPQVGLSADQRRRNLSGAFKAHPATLARLRGRGVVLVDDVITTGSTVDAVTRALQRAGVDKIDVISFARVVMGGDGPI